MATNEDRIIYSSPMEGLEVLSCSSDRPFGNHLHDGYVLWLNSECGEKYQLKRNSDILQPGSVSIIEPETIHSNEPCSSPRRHLRSFYLSENFVQQIQSKLGVDKGAEPQFRNRIINDSAVWSELGRLHSYLLSPSETMVAESFLLNTFALLYRIDRGCSMTPQSTEDSRVSMVVEYLHAHMETNISLAELAELTGCTEFHLIRIFKSHRGLPPHSYLVQLRLERARKLLTCGSSISDAALMAGFSDQSHLTRLFKSRYGLPPRRYRDNLARFS